MAFDLEAFREMVKDGKMHVGIGLVDQVEVLPDLSKARVQVRVFPEENEVIATQSAAAAGPDAGIHQLSAKNDLVLLGFVSEDDVYVLAKLTSTDDTIPAKVALGHMVIKSLAGKNLHLASDTGVLIGAGGLLDPDEPLVLGNVLGDMLDELIAEVDDALLKIIVGPVGTGNLGFAVPTWAALGTDLALIRGKIAAIKLKYLDTPVTDIKSAKHMTER